MFPHCGAATAPATASLGDFVWNDSNGNGLQDAGEAGVAGVSVQLLTDGVVTASTMTDQSGHYLFTGLDTSTQHGYAVRFVLPSGYSFTTVHAGDLTLDSDADATTGQTQTVFLTSGQNETGLVSTGSSAGSGTVSGRAWLDSNHDGIRQAGEDPIAGLLVELHDATTGALVSTQTLMDGTYQFTNVSAGSYYLVFSHYQDYVFTLEHQGSDDTLDSDADSSGTTAQFTLGDGEIRDHLDVGLYPPA